MNKMFKMKEVYTFLVIGLLIFSTLALASSAVKLFDTNTVPRGLKIAPDGSQDVNIQDQTTRPAMLRLSLIDDLTPTLAEVPKVGAYTITLEAGHSVTANKSLSIIYDEGGLEFLPHFYTPKVLSVAANVLTLDEPVPYPFPVNSICYTSTHNMNVDGSSTAKVYGITNVFSTAADITQVIFHITDATDMDDSLFGGMPALTRGIVFRKKLKDGHYENIFNVKSNGEFGEISGPADKAYDSKAPAGVYGYTVKINFSGQENIGVAIRLNQGESIELVIQDDLTDLLTFVCYIEGHFTN